jgi:hypothetical protein
MYQDRDRRRAVPPEDPEGSKLLGFVLMVATGVFWALIFWYGLTG